MSNIFISYNRQSEAIARMLVSDIESLGFTVWFDQDLSGGQAWWNQILAKIRDCDVLVFMMDAHSLDSTACKREFGYADAVGKPILPILAADGVSTTLLPPELNQLQFIDYRNQDRKTIASLAKALMNLPPAKPLPDPLPPPPEIPVSYLGGLAQKIDKTSSLSFKDQSVLLVELKRSLKDRRAEDDTRTLLRRFRKRHDLFVVIAEEIDDLIGKPVQMSTDPLVSALAVSELKAETPAEPEKSLHAVEPDKSPHPVKSEKSPRTAKHEKSTHAVKPKITLDKFKSEKSLHVVKPEKSPQPVEPDPSQGVADVPKQPVIFQDLEETEIIAKEETPLQIETPKSPSKSNEITLRQRMIFAITGIFTQVPIALIIMWITDNQLISGAIVTNGIAGAIIGVIYRGRKKLIFTTIIGFAVGFFLSLLFTPGYKDVGVSNGLVFGGPIGAILGAILGASYLDDYKSRKA